MKLNKNNNFRKTEQNRKVWHVRAVNWIKRMLCRKILSVQRVWNSTQKETKHWLAMISAVGVLLLAAVIVLSLNLYGMAKRLETAEAMSVSLQEELELARAEGEKNVTEEEKKADAVITDVQIPSVTAVPTQTIEEKKYIVCVDAGHGDWDGGAVLKVDGREERIEKDDNLWISTLFKEALEAYGVKVVMTRDDDVYLGLSERTDIANAAGADALISFHRNSYAVEGTLQLNEVSGVEIWLHNSKPEEANKLAERMLNALSEVGGMKNRGIKYGTMGSDRDNYAINREANMTSMIVELGFITSDADNTAYDKNGQDYAEAMARAVYEWLEELGGGTTVTMEF